MPLTYLEHDGGRLAVQIEGEGNARLGTVICSPGMGDTRDGFDALAAALVEAGYRVAYFDLRGHGDSSIGFTHYGDVAVADDFQAVMKHFGEGTYVLAGDSLSAGGAVIAAGRAPEKVVGFLLFAPFLRNPPMAGLLRGIMSVALWRPWGPAVWKFYAGTLWPGLGDKLPARAKHTTELLTRPGYWPAFHATVMGATHEKVTPWLPVVKEKPALVVMGEKDPDWSDPAVEAKWIASNFTTSEIVSVPEAGHAPMYEKPEVVIPPVVTFLKGIKF